MMKRLFKFLIPGVLVLAAGLFGLARWLLTDLPSVNSVAQNLNPPSIRITDRFGRTLYEVLGDQSGRNAVVPLSDIPESLIQASIATEDSSFYQNPGIDLRGILRAAWINLRGGETIAGGSTITQQVARNLLMTANERSERTIKRKLREGILAWQITRRYSKDQILDLYLNQTYYGGMSYGVEAAAQTYFGKPVSELDLAECAMLAGLPQAPNEYNPFTHPEAARQRQQVVLGLMEASGEISHEQRLLAEREPLVLAKQPYPIEAPHFVMMVRSQVDELFTPEEIYQHGGLVVRTTLNLDWQHLAEDAIQRQLQALKYSPDGLGHNTNNAALVAIDPQNGQILALVGSPNYFDTQDNGAINMAISPRQPGSALKPILYAAALDPSQPNPWTAATMLLDVKTSFVTHDGKSYTPSNYDLKEHGPVLLRDALGSSLNIPAVITMDHVGLPRLFQLATKLGITTLKDPQNYDLSLALGGGEVRLSELTAAYGAFASGGFRVDPTTIMEIRDFQGNTLYTPRPQPMVRVLDARVAWLISNILSDNNARIIGFGPNSILRLDRPAAVKTGTTSNFHDNWTVGYTPNLVVGVWTGNTDYEPMRDVNGLAGAAPIWHEFMRAALAGQPVQNFSQPGGLVQVKVCALSGLLPTDACPYQRLEWFIDSTQPTQKDTLYKAVLIDSRTGRLADANTPTQDRVRQVVLDLPPNAQAWAHAQGLTLLSDLESLVTDQAGKNSQDVVKLQIISPSPSSTYRIASNLAASDQRIPIEAAGNAELRQVTLWVDGVQVAQFNTSPYQTWWQLSPGQHQVWARALLENGQTIQSQVISFDVEPPVKGGN
jgi:1A family penicillin-binding protein